MFGGSVHRGRWANRSHSAAAFIRNNETSDDSAGMSGMCDRRNSTESRSTSTHSLTNVLMMMVKNIEQSGEGLI